MAKTKPMGVRFHEPTFEKLKLMGYTSHQKALSFLERFWIETVPKLVEFNNQLENKERILKEREGKVSIKNFTKTQTGSNRSINTLEPKEGSMAFYNKYGVFTLKELEEKKSTTKDNQ